jgi:hypothetical protein
MKIKLAEDVIVMAHPDELGCIGCHRISCPDSASFCYNECLIAKRGLDGRYYPIDNVEDLIYL